MKTVAIILVVVIGLLIGIHFATSATQAVSSIQTKRISVLDSIN